MNDIRPVAITETKDFCQHDVISKPKQKDGLLVDVKERRFL